jgi:hypothetical protein
LVTVLIAKIKKSISCYTFGFIIFCTLENNVMAFSRIMFLFWVGLLLGGNWPKICTSEIGSFLRKTFR